MSGKHDMCRRYWQRHAALLRQRWPDVRPMADFSLTHYGGEDYAVYGPHDFFAEVRGCCRYDARAEGIIKYMRWRSRWFRLGPKQSKNIEDAIATAKRMTEPGGSKDAFGLICADFLESHGGIETVGDYLKRVEEQTGLKLKGFTASDLERRLPSRGDRDERDMDR